MNRKLLKAEVLEALEEMRLNEAKRKWVEDGLSDFVDFDDMPPHKLARTDNNPLVKEHRC